MNLATLPSRIFSFAAIKHIPYHSRNLLHLSALLQLPPHKQTLTSLMQHKLQQICPDQPLAKKSFDQLQGQVADLYSFIKSDIIFETDKEMDQEFLQRAHYYFQKEGKKVRPLMVYMLAQNYANALAERGEEVPAELWADMKKWGAQIEIMHIASLAHDDIVDDSPSRRGQQSQHLKYGSRAAVFSGNYIISKSSKSVASFNSARLYEIYAHTMSSLAEG